VPQPLCYHVPSIVCRYWKELGAIFWVKIIDHSNVSKERNTSIFRQNGVSLLKWTCYRLLGLRWWIIQNRFEGTNFFHLQFIKDVTRRNLLHFSKIITNVSKEQTVSIFEAEQQIVIQRNVLSSSKNNMIGHYQRFGRTCCLFLQGTMVDSHTEESAGSIFRADGRRNSWENRAPISLWARDLPRNPRGS
jgi:hypothetical protein